MRLLDQLIVTEEVLNSLFLAIKLILQNFYLGFELNTVVPQLVIEHLHLYGLII